MNERRPIPPASETTITAGEGKQSAILNRTSDDDDPRPELARDREPKPEDAAELKRAMDEDA